MIVVLSIRYLASRLLCTESESKVANLCNLSRLKPSTEALPELRVTSHGLRLKLLTFGVGDSLLLPFTSIPLGPTLAKANLHALFSLTYRSSNWRNLNFKTKYGIVQIL